FQQQKEPDVPYVPTPEEVVEKMLAVAGVGEDDVLYDLGCGDGRIIITAAKEFGCRGVGIDIDPERIRESRTNAANEGVEDRVEFYQMDLFEADISEATVVTLYLLTEVNLRLRPKLLRELRPGTRVVSHDFDMGKWRADKEAFVEDDWEMHSIFFWIIPANASGTWEWDMPTGTENKKYTLKLQQKFQQVTGIATEGSLFVPVSIREIKICGNTLQFALERKQRRQKERFLFEGELIGHSVVGFVKKEGSTRVMDWKAKRNPSTQTPIDNSVQDVIYVELLHVQMAHHALEAVRKCQ
ncbi:MAG: class I SAM-dependent methyltransferase, partial [Candidatus Aminicenantes bacterium]